MGNTLKRKRAVDTDEEEPDDDEGSSGSDEGELYTINKVLRSRFIENNEVEYLVSWVGYGPQDNSWISIENCTTPEELLGEFHRRNPDQPCPPQFEKYTRQGRGLRDPAATWSTQNPPKKQTSPHRIKKKPEQKKRRRISSSASSSTSSSSDKDQPLPPPKTKQRIQKKSFPGEPARPSPLQGQVGAQEKRGSSSHPHSQKKPAPPPQRRKPPDSLQSQKSGLPPSKPKTLSDLPTFQKVGSAPKRPVPQNLETKKPERKKNLAKSTSTPFSFPTPTSRLPNLSGKSKPFGKAGLFEIKRGPGKPEDDPNAWHRPDFEDEIFGSDTSSDNAAESERPFKVSKRNKSLRTQSPPPQANEDADNDSLFGGWDSDTSTSPNNQAGSIPPPPQADPPQATIAHDHELEAYQKSQAERKSLDLAELKKAARRTTSHLFPKLSHWGFFGKSTEPAIGKAVKKIWSIPDGWEDEVRGGIGWVYAPKRGPGAQGWERETEDDPHAWKLTKEQSIKNDVVALRLLLLSDGAIIGGANPRSFEFRDELNEDVNCVFVHISEAEKLNDGLDGLIEKLEGLELRRRMRRVDPGDLALGGKRGPGCFVIFGSWGDRKNVWEYQWFSGVATTFTSRVLRTRPRFFGDAFENVFVPENPKSLYLSPWLHPGLVCNNAILGEFKDGHVDPYANCLDTAFTRTRVTAAIQDDNILVPCTPSRRGNSTNIGSNALSQITRCPIFPSPHDQLNLDIVDRWVDAVPIQEGDELGDIFDLVKPAKRRYTFIKRWVVIMTSDQKAEASPLLGVEYLTPEEFENAFLIGGELI